MIFQLGTEGTAVWDARVQACDEQTLPECVQVCFQTTIQSTELNMFLGFSFLHRGCNLVFQKKLDFLPDPHCAGIIRGETAKAGAVNLSWFEI